MPSPIAEFKVREPIGEKPPSRRDLILGLVILGVVFAFPLYRLLAFALHSDLFSYVLLVPLVSGYFLHLQRKNAPPHVGLRHLQLGIPLTAVGGIGVLAYYLFLFSGAAVASQNMAALAGASFVVSLTGVVAMFSDRAQLRAAAFPLAFLLFMVPFPVSVEQAIESFLQHSSAPPAHWLFQLAGTPVFKEGLVFQLSNIKLQVAPECSGIRSTIVLFMTSIIAGKLFLRSPWRRFALTAFVVPLALLRNGFRIFTIGELCVHMGPHMIHSDIHHKGGAIFFALSLIPFFAAVYLLIRSEKNARARITSLNPSS